MATVRVGESKFAIETVSENRSWQDYEMAKYM